jgi:hypothetical protein
MRNMLNDPRQNDEFWLGDDACFDGEETRYFRVWRCGEGSFSWAELNSEDKELGFESSGFETAQDAHHDAVIELGGSLR